MIRFAAVAEVPLVEIDRGGSDRHELEPERSRAPARLGLPTGIRGTGVRLSRRKRRLAAGLAADDREVDPDEREVGVRGRCRGIAERAAIAAGTGVARGRPVAARTAG